MQSLQKFVESKQAPKPFKNNIPNVPKAKKKNPVHDEAASAKKETRGNIQSSPQEESQSISGTTRLCNTSQANDFSKKFFSSLQLKSNKEITSYEPTNLLQTISTEQRFFSSFNNKKIKDKYFKIIRLNLLKQVKQIIKITEKNMINKIIYNDKGHIVSIFKDYLIYDDIKEEFQEVYSLKESLKFIKTVGGSWNNNFFLVGINFEERKIIEKGKDRKEKIRKLKKDDDKKGEEGSTFFLTTFMNSLAKEDLSNSVSRLPANSLECSKDEEGTKLYDLLGQLNKIEPSVIVKKAHIELIPKKPQTGSKVIKTKISLKKQGEQSKNAQKQIKALTSSHRTLLSKETKNLLNKGRESAALIKQNKVVLNTKISNRVPTVCSGRLSKLDFRRPNESSEIGFYNLNKGVDLEQPKALQALMNLTKLRATPKLDIVSLSNISWNNKLGLVNSKEEVASVVVEQQQVGKPSSSNGQYARLKRYINPKVYGKKQEKAVQSNKGLLKMAAETINKGQLQASASSNILSQTIQTGLKIGPKVVLQQNKKPAYNIYIKPTKNIASIFTADKQKCIK